MIILIINLPVMFLINFLFSKTSQDGVEGDFFKSFVLKNYIYNVYLTAQNTSL